MRHVLALIGLALATPATADLRQTDRALDRMARVDISEPAWSAEEIRKPPRRYQGNAAYLYRETTPAIVAAMCKSDLAVGCAIGGFVIGPNACDPMFAGERFAALHCHEKGHVLGWSPEHPD